MEFRRLYYFYILTEYMNFTKAADYLHITQPTLSQQIAELENFLEIKLFNRTNKKVELTAAGEALQQETAKLLAQYDRCIQVSSSYKEGYAGQITIASLDVIEPTFLPQFLKYFMCKYENIQINLNTANYSEMLSMVEKNTTDFAMTLMPVFHKTHDIKMLKVNMDRLVIGIPNIEPYKSIQALPDIRINEILSLPGIMFTGWYKCEEAVTYLRTFSKDLSISYMDSASLTIMTILKRNGFTLAPEKWLNFMDAPRNLHHILLPKEYSDLNFGLMYNISNPNPCLPLFLKEATDYLKKESTA